MNVWERLRAGSVVSAVALLAFCLTMLGYGVTEEVPLGSVTGLVRSEVTGRPVANATVILRPQASLRGEDLPVRTARTDAAGRFAIRAVPAGGYWAEAYSKAHEFTGPIPPVTEGRPTILEIAMKPTAPYFTAYLNQRVVLPDEAPFLQVHGFSPASEVLVDVFEIGFDEIERRGGRVADLMSPWQDGRRLDAAKQPYARKVRSSRTPITLRDAEGVFRQDVRLEPLPEGVYLLRLKCGKKTSDAGLFVSRLALVTKSYGHSVLAFVSDLETGMPVANAEVSGEGGAPARTGANGIARLTLTEGRESGSVAVTARYGESRAICSPYVFQRSRSENVRIWHASDRPVYRPGDEVHFKGVIRLRTGSDYTLPGLGLARVAIRDPEGNVIERQQLSVGAHGSFHGSFETSSEMTGSYILETSFDGAEETYWIQVASYRKPQFRVTVTPIKPAFVGREPVRMKVKCEYYFGGPVVGATISGSVFAMPQWASFDPDDAWYDHMEGVEGDYLGDFVGTLDERRTDANGEVLLTWSPRELADPDEWVMDLDRRLTFSVYASENDQYFEGRGSALLTQGEFALRVESDRWLVSPGEPVTWTARAVRNGTDQPMSGVPIRVEYGYDDWNPSLRESRFLRDGTLEVKTDARGEARITLTPNRPGEFRIKLSARDSPGNLVRSNQWLWVYREGGFAASGPMPDLQVLLDKKSYAPGEEAQVVIRTGSPGGAALLTVEGDRVYSAQVVQLTEATTVVRLPVRAEYLPNVFVAATYVKNKTLHTAERRLSLDTSVRRLHLTVTPDRPVAKPGERVRFTLEARTPEGEPVETELALGVVDEAVYAIREDRNDPLAAFYPRRWNAVITNYSFPALYLDGGDKSAAEIDIRRDFRDTAAWFPSIMTGPDGRAKLDVDLPDNLGAWRATTFGVSASGASGKASSQVIAQKDLMVRLNAPAHLTQNDEVRVSALVTQHTGRGARVNVRLRAEGGRLAGRPTQTVDIAEGRTQWVSWNLKAGAGPSAKLTAEAWIDQGPSDGVQQSLAIRAHGRVSRQTESGALTERTEIRFARLDGATQGRMRLSVAASLAGPMLEALDELVDFPFGCVEQTMSRFMPAAVVARTMRDLDRADPALEARIAEVAKRSYDRLRTMQHADGGWGWWEQDDSHAWTTGLVLEGIFRAQAAGFASPPGMKDRALQWATRRLRETPATFETDAERILLAYTLALHGRSRDLPQGVLLARTNQATPETLALLALTHQLIGDEAAAERTFARLMTAQRDEASGVLWDDPLGRGTTARALQAALAIGADTETTQRIVAELVRRRRGFGWENTFDTSQVLVGLTEYLRRTGELSSTYQVVVSMNGREVTRLSVTPENAATATAQVDLPIRELSEGEHTLVITRIGQGGGYYGFSLEQTPFTEPIGELLNASRVRVVRTFHALTPMRLRDGSMRLMPSRQPVTRFTSGQPVRCRVVVSSPIDQSYFLIEVPVPSNMVVVENLDPETWTWWWSAQQVFDDRIAQFATRVPKGDSTFEFTLRAESPGQATALPVEAYAMYATTQRGSSSAISVEVRPK